MHSWAKNGSRSPASGPVFLASSARTPDRAIDHAPRPVPGKRDRQMPSPPNWQLDSESSVALLRLSGDWLVQNGATEAANDIPLTISRMTHCTSLRFDMTSVEHWDSSLLAFIWLFLASIDRGGQRFDADLSPLPAPLRRMLILARSDHPETQPRESGPALTSAGTWMSGWRHQLIASAELIGMTIQSILPGLRGRVAVRSVDIVALMRESGPGALSIITIVNGLVGGI